MKRHVLDQLLAKAVSRKLAAWIAGTIALGMGAIDPDAWVALTCVYVGTQGVQDIAATVLGSRSGGGADR